MTTNRKIAMAFALLVSGDVLAQQECSKGVCSMPYHMRGWNYAPAPPPPAREDIYTVLALSPTGGASVAKDYDDPYSARLAALWKCAENSGGAKCNTFDVWGPYCFSTVRGRTTLFMESAGGSRQAQKKAFKACRKAKDKPCELVPHLNNCNKLIPVGSPTRSLLVWFDEVDLHPKSKEKNPP